MRLQIAHRSFLTAETKLVRPSRALNGLAPCRRRKKSKRAGKKHFRFQYRVGSYGFFFRRPREQHITSFSFLMDFDCMRSLNKRTNDVWNERNVKEARKKNDLWWWWWWERKALSTSALNWIPNRLRWSFVRNMLCNRLLSLIWLDMGPRKWHLERTKNECARGVIVRL